MSNPVLALFLAALLWLVPLASRAHDGDHVEVTGEFEVIQADDFEHGRSELHYFVNDRATGQGFELHFDGPPPPFRTGQQVSVRGRSFGRALHSASVAALGGSGSGASGGQTAAAATTGERNVVALLVDLNDATASSRYTVSQVADALWTGARSVDGLYRAASFSQLGLAPDPDGDGFAEVFGPYAINDSATPCDYTAWANAADAAASAAGVNLALYRHRVYVLPRYNELSCGWAGLANVGCGTYCRSWIAEGESPMVYAHELGHNLSMHHAATDPENDGIANSEYGDGSDPMGSSRQWRLFNAPHVDQLGWLQAYPGSIVDVTANASYDLFPIGLHPSLAAGPQILRVPRPGTGGYYYLSFRRALDYDATLSSTFTRGVNLHSYAGAGANLTYFISSLIDGGIFQDAANGIEVQQQFRTPDGSSVSVQVSFNCIPRSPTLTLSPASQATNGSSSPRYTISVTNRDGSICDPASFGLSGSFPAGIQGTLTPSSLVLAPGASATATLDLTTSTANGRFGFSVQAADALRSGSGSAEIVVDTLAPLPATLTGTLKRRAQIQLNWSGASDDTGSGLSAYRLHREGGSGAAVNVITSSTSYLDTSTVSGVIYTYTVHARDAAGNESVASNAIAINTGSTTSGGGKGGKPH